MVNPFDECSDQVLRRESYYALLRSFTEMASGLPEKIRSRLVLEVSPFFRRHLMLPTQSCILLNRKHGQKTQYLMFSL